MGLDSGGQGSFGVSIDAAQKPVLVIGQGQNSRPRAERAGEVVRVSAHVVCCSWLGIFSPMKALELSLVVYRKVFWVIVRGWGSFRV